MTTAGLIDKLSEKSVTLARVGDRLRVEATAGTLSPDLRAGIVARKAELLAVLAGEWFDAAAALLARHAGKIDDDEWWTADELFTASVSRACAGGMSRRDAERDAYEKLANRLEGNAGI